MNFFKLLAALTLVALAACTSFNFGRINPGDPIDRNETVVVLGVGSNQDLVSIFAGTIRDGRFQQGLSAAQISGAAIDGYIVAKASPGQVLAITVVHRKDGSALGSRFHPCGGNRVLTFEVPSARVIYVGDVRYTPARGWMTQEVFQNHRAAASYIDRAYPALRGRVEAWPTRMLPVSTSCTPDPIPIVIPMGR